MDWRAAGIGLLALTSLCPTAISAQPLPHFQRNGEAIQLMVDGEPFLALAGELHNSSPSSPEYMAEIWDKLERRGVRTVIGAASWELVEPREGQYDFAAVDDQIKQARKHGMHLVMIWFGSYKNAESKYAPSWVRRDEQRFPRAVREKSTPMGAFFTTMLSVFNDRLADADARAFAALMRHIKAVDKDQTVIMMQVENEVGLLGDSRDRSRDAAAAWRKEVPAELIRYLKAHRATLQPSLAELWGSNGFRENGSWEQVFGKGAAADEVFMAWGFGGFVNRVASAGAAEYGLPMYANAWLGPQPGFNQPGEYPSGGPVAGMMDVWKAAAPSLVLLAPDIYVEDFEGALAGFQRADNPVFIPEAKFDAGNLFIALGKYNAVAFSPFGIEDEADTHDIFKAYAVLDGMSSLITRAQAEGRIRGFKLASGAKQSQQLGDYELSISGPTDTVGAFGAGTGFKAIKTSGYGLAMQVGRDEFLIVGQGITVAFSRPGAQVEVDTVQEGRFDHGKWIAGRTLNGDERYSLFPADSLRAVHVILLRR